MKRAPLSVHQFQSAIGREILVRAIRSASRSVVEEMAPMEDGRDRRRRGPQVVEQILRRDDLGELALGDVAPFLIRTEPVADDDLVPAPRLEPRHQVRSDETGAAGHDD